MRSPRLTRSFLAGAVLLGILAGFTLSLPLQADEKSSRQIFEMSGKGVICRLEEKMIKGTITQKELNLLYDIFIYYSKEIVQEEISPRDEEVFYEAFKATELYYKTCPPEEKKRDLEVLRQKCK